MTNTGKKDPQELLEELESIKSLLDGQDHDDIPLLQEMVPDLSTPPLPKRQAKPISEDTTEAAEETTLLVEEPLEDLAPGVLPGQQSLFNEPKKEVKSKPATPQVPPSASSENPFLPKHIRERLKSKTGIAGIHAFTAAPMESPPPSNTEQIVDALVREFLPQIEQRLRHQLLELIKDDKNF